MNSEDFNPLNYKAFLFDMDGVLTKTADVHAACWKRMFDEFLKEYAEQKGMEFKPFDLEEDYKRYVDGKPRYAGVRSFIESRDISLPEDSEDGFSVLGLGDRKNAFIHEVLEADGVKIFEGTVNFIRYLRDKEVPVAVVSSSENCEVILKAAGIEDLFDYRVDGSVAKEKGLAGKPAPDMFLTAAEALGVKPEESVVVEDAISGVEAGKNGSFGLVIGVNHDNDFETLKEHGAHFVVSGLGAYIL